MVVWKQKAECGSYHGRTCAVGSGYCSDAVGELSYRGAGPHTNARTALSFYIIFNYIASTLGVLSLYSVYVGDARFGMTP
jgi:hypothetical protein